MVVLQLCYQLLPNRSPCPVHVCACFPFSVVCTVENLPMRPYGTYVHMYIIHTYVFAYNNHERRVISRQDKVISPIAMRARTYHPISDTLMTGQLRRFKS